MRKIRITLLAAVVLAPCSLQACQAFTPPEYTITRELGNEANGARERETDRQLHAREHDADRADDRASQEKEHGYHFWVDVGTLGALIGSLIAFIWQAILLRRTLNETRNTYNVSQQSLALARDALLIDQSAVLFKHAVETLGHAYVLVQDTTDDYGELDPNLGNLRNWDTAAYLLKRAQFLRTQFIATQHKQLYDDVELPRYQRMFSQLVRVPWGFDPRRYYRGGWPEHGTGRGVTINDFIDGAPLSVIYRFATLRSTNTLTLEEEPSIGKYLVGMTRGGSPPGLAEYIEMLLKAKGEG